MGLLRIIGWIACVIYATVPSFWLVIHPRVDSWRKRKRERRAAYAILLPMWVGMWVVLGALSWPWHGVLLYRNPLAWIPGALLIFLGFWLYSRAKRGFSPMQLSGHAELEPEQHEQRLVISGIRERVRHPIYLGHLCEMLGWSIGTGMAALYGLTVFAIATGAIMIRLEERELRTRFGDSYREYQHSVPAILPRLFS